MLFRDLADKAISADVKQQNMLVGPVFTVENSASVNIFVRESNQVTLSLCFIHALSQLLLQLLGIGLASSGQLED